MQLPARLNILWSVFLVFALGQVQSTSCKDHCCSVNLVQDTRRHDLTPTCRRHPNKGLDPPRRFLFFFLRKRRDTRFVLRHEEWLGPCSLSSLLCVTRCT
ncbi:hypothetical protein V8C40DRAFT_134231 [Trichoderma camerunense]